MIAHICYFASVILYKHTDWLYLSNDTLIPLILLLGMTYQYIVSAKEKKHHRQQNSKNKQETQLILDFLQRSTKSQGDRKLNRNSSLYFTQDKNRFSVNK